MYTVHSPFTEPARLLGVQFTKSFDVKVTKRRSKAVTACAQNRLCHARSMGPPHARGKPGVPSTTRPGDDINYRVGDSVRHVALDGHVPWVPPATGTHRQPGVSQIRGVPNGNCPVDLRPGRIRWDNFRPDTGEPVRRNVRLRGRRSSRRGG